MKIGMNFLLWTGHVTEEHSSTFRKLKAVGFDGVEIPVFDTSSPAHYQHLGRILDDLGLERIIGVTHPGNRASQHVLTKIGMTDEGWGRYYDRRLRLFAILGSEL